MVSCDCTNDGSVGAPFRHGTVSGLWGGVSAIPGSGYEIQGQNHVARLQGMLL